ncbi:MAG: hypothetical protein JXA14_04410 [Anaerolineae bacterium]|nr:hypothetical protein [Anaerolineae bacterium]
MNPLTRRPAFLILLAVGVILGGVLVVRAAVAQDTQPPGADRAEGTLGRAGSIHGLAATQMPALQPPGLTTVYHFSGALNDDAGTTLSATVVQCSNIGAGPTLVEVQLFEFNASSVYTASVLIDPLATATFESDPVAFYLADVFLNAGTVSQGYGRILAEHAGLVCTVQTLDPTGSPPAWSFDIPIYSESTYGIALPAILRNATP